MAGDTLQGSAGTLPTGPYPSSGYAFDWEKDAKLEELGNQVDKLTEQVDRLESIISEMGAMISGLPIGFSFVDANDKSLGETKEMVMGYYLAHRGEAIYPDDVANELGLDLKVTMNAVKDLIGEGRIEEVH